MIELALKKSIILVFLQEEFYAFSGLVQLKFGKFTTCFATLV
jgi:hypothetical protein